MIDTTMGGTPREHIGPEYTTGHQNDLTHNLGEFILTPHDRLRDEEEHTDWVCNDGKVDSFKSDRGHCFRLGQINPDGVHADSIRTAADILEHFQTPVGAKMGPTTEQLQASLGPNYILQQKQLLKKYKSSAGYVVRTPLDNASLEARELMALGINTSSTIQEVETAMGELSR